VVGTPDSLFALETTTGPALDSHLNLMTYGDDVTQMQSDVARTISQGLPAPKLVVGLDIFDGPDPPAGGCGQFSTHAAQAGLMGAFVWFAQADTSNVCANGLAAG
jgi:hypothetical protein